MAKIMIAYILFLIPAVIFCKPNPQAGSPIQLAVLPHVETVDQKPSGPSTYPAVPANNPSQIGGAIHLEEVHDEHSNTDAPNTQGHKAPGCPRLYKPVCGSDNVTYNSPCELEAAQGKNSSLKQAKDGPC